MSKKPPKSLRKFIRREKARIRREVLDVREQEKLIQELYQKVFGKLKIKIKEKYEDKRDLQFSHSERN